MTNILTLRLDDLSQAQFEQLRQRHFPPERNLIPAHLTLFHSLPATAEADIVLQSEVRRQPPFSVSVTGVRSLGKGVAYKLASPALQGLHARLSERFAPDLIPQDRQRFQPHIVVQNKVSPEAARALLATLQAAFVPSEVHAVGLDLWHYLGGPWSLAQTLVFPL